MSFTGAVGPASRPCGADYTAQAVESARAVVVIVYEHPSPRRRRLRCRGRPANRHRHGWPRPWLTAPFWSFPHGTPVATMPA